MSSGALLPSVSLSMSAAPSAFGSNRPPRSCGSTETNSEHRGGGVGLAHRNHHRCCDWLSSSSRCWLVTAFKRLPRPAYGRWLVRHGTLDLGRIFVLSHTLVSDLTKQVVVCPCQIFDPVFASSCGAGTAATRSNPIPRTSLDDTVTRRALSIGARGLPVPAAIATRSYGAHRGKGTQRSGLTPQI
jgi:hypothetical protein